MAAKTLTIYEYPACFICKQRAEYRCINNWLTFCKRCAIETGHRGSFGEGIRPLFQRLDQWDMVPKEAPAWE